MLHCLESADHRFDPRTHLFVLLQQGCTFGGEPIEPLTQSAIFLAQLSGQQDQFIEAGFEKAQFLIDDCVPGDGGDFDVAHAADYAAALRAGSNNAPRNRTAMVAPSCGDAGSRVIPYVRANISFR